MFASSPIKTDIKREMKRRLQGNFIMTSRVDADGCYPTVLSSLLDHETSLTEILISRSQKKRLFITF